MARFRTFGMAHSSRVTRALAVTLIASAAFLQGCIGSNPGKAPSLYLLTARAQPGTATLNTSIGVGPVRVAPFLRQPQIVTHAGGGALNVAHAHRWSEPLDQGIQRVLLQNLTALTGADLRNFPWTQSTIPQYAFRIDVTELDRAADGKAMLAVTWVLEDVIAGKMLQSRHSTFTSENAVADPGAKEADTKEGAGNYAALTTAYSDLIAQLAQQLAEAVATDMQQRAK